MKSAILRTLAYADIFDYPLTASEIHHWLIWELASPPSAASISRAIQKPHPQIEKEGKYYTLKNRRHLATLRRQRQKFSSQKLKIARGVGKWLKIIPFIKMVSITGALAMNNADEHDDIDLFIVTQANRLWLTRLIVVPLVSLVAKRRKPASHYPLVASRYKDSICLNLFLDETCLSLPLSSRNLYTAHEISQVKLLWSRPNRQNSNTSGKDTYKKFLSSNSWIKSFLPNIKIADISTQNAKPTPSPLAIGYWVLAILEHLTYKFQCWYMKKRMTREKISPHSAFFHPNNMRKHVMREYAKRLRKLNLNP